MGKTSISEINNILSNSFSYLAESSRVYAYVSSDGKYVIKLFKTPEEINAQFKAWGMDPDWSLGVPQRTERT